MMGSYIALGSGTLETATDTTFGSAVHPASRLGEIIAAGDGVDLHSHSRHSDGDWTPPELIAEASRLGLRLVSLTDHDTVAGQQAARRSAEEEHLLFLSGMEVSLSVHGRPYHILCFDLDPTSLTWAIFAERRKDRYEHYYLDLFEQLRSRGYAVAPDLARGPDGRFVPGPLAVALQRSGQASSVESAQQLLRGLGLRYQIEQTYQDVEEFGQILHAGDGIFSVAHPARQQAGVSVRLTEDDLRVITRAVPLVALEASHPYHSAADVAAYASLAAQHGLAITCGSDAHGQRYGRPLQKYPASLCFDFLQLVRQRWANRALAPAQSA
jgi:predicted metal-dependent phosphoesterase TrpH